MNIKVCGADVCKDKIVCCFLSEEPKDALKYLGKNKKAFPAFKATLKDAKEFLNHSPTHLVLEPTGTHYAWIFAELATQHNIKVLWAPNHKCKAFRTAYDLDDKNDQTDAFALALLGLREVREPGACISFNHRDGLTRLRELVLQHDSINRMKNPVVNRLRQQLAREFPEAALKRSKAGSDGQTPLWSFLAGIERKTQRKSSYYLDMWNESLARYLGLEISDFSRTLAKTLHNYEVEQQRIEAEMLQELKKPCFEPYKRVLFGFGLDLKLQAWVVAMTFPLDRFFGDDGMKKAKGRFKQRLGWGKVDNSSGDKVSSKAAGSSVSRRLMYMHVLHTCAGDNPRSCSKNQDRVVDYYRYLTDRWNNHPEAIASRERATALKKSVESLDRELKGVLDPSVIKKIKTVLAAGVNAGFDLSESKDKGDSRWKKLIISRTAAKLTEYIWSALLKELYPKA